MAEPNIIRYDWKHEGIVSETMVDLTYAQDIEARKDLPVSLRVSVLPQKAREGDRLSTLEEMRVNSLQKKIEKIAASSGSIIPGIRRKGNVIELYCYCPDEDAADKISEAAGASKWAILDSALKLDPSWTIYMRELYPTPPQMQTVKNEELINLMLQYEDDLHSPRPIDHYCTFRDEVSRIGFQEEARKSGFALGDPYFAPDTDLPHGAVVRNLGAIDKRAIDESTTKIIAIADKYEGRYCGWNAPLRKRKKGRPG